MPVVSPVIASLNDLLSACRAAEAGFREAARRLRSDELRTVLLNRASDHREEAEAIERWIAEYGGVAAPRGGSAVGQVLQKVANAVRSSLDERGGDTAVLGACARVQAGALARFRAALDHELPPPVMNMIGRRMEDLQRDLDQLAALRDGTAVA
jgi:uncharacterized protein (TIGR02284 family)